MEEAIKDVIKRGRVFVQDRIILEKLMRKIENYFKFTWIPDEARDYMNLTICRGGKALIIGDGRTKLHDGTICLTPSSLIMEIPDKGYTIHLDEITSVSRLLTILYNIDTIIEIYREAIKTLREKIDELNRYKETYINNLETMRNKLYTSLTNSV